jgi:hypothetical protein
VTLKKRRIKRRAAFSLARPRYEKIKIFFSIDGCE